MGSRYVMRDEVETTSFDWGSAGMRCHPGNSGSRALVVMDVVLTPGNAHPFHHHPDQDEMIIVKAGTVTQYLESERRELRPGDSIYIDRGVVHASYNDGTETVELQVVLAPAAGDGGYETVDVSAEAPWSGLR